MYVSLNASWHTTYKLQMECKYKMFLKDTSYCMYIHINIPLNIFVVPGYNILVCTALLLVYTMLLNVKPLRPIGLMTGGCYWLWRLRNDLSANWSNDNAVFLIVFWLWSSSDEFWPPFPYSVYHTRTCFPGSSFLIATCSSACTIVSDLSKPGKL